MGIGRFKFLTNFFVIFILIALITRIVLSFFTQEQMDLSSIELIKVFLIGLFYDVMAYFYYIIPFVIYLILIPNKIFNSKLHKIISLAIYFAIIYSVVFNAFSEYFFWDEFGKRFNFIAVDYLVYTHEVVNNILESYPIPLLVTIIFFITLFIFFIICKVGSFCQNVFKSDIPFKKRLVYGAFILLFPLLFFMTFDKQNITHSCKNKYNQELAKNGFYSLFSAFRHNELDYYEFYKTLPDNEALSSLRSKLKRENVQIKSDNISQIIKSDKEFKKHNIMLIMVESLSASYMGTYGDDRGLTPHLDELVKKSMFFDNFYATGTRTVRGMEAVTLSLPPTPGRSIVKRPDCKGLRSAGVIFDELGYESKFIYAGHGYFDNMNFFFSNNGFKVVDRFDFDDNEITFANVWGVCDEDLFGKASKEADKSYEAKKPFFSFVMTTSNHRPYTYPDNKIDIPSHTGRSGGVKYTDFAIDKFLKDSKSKPWFDDTIFVIVADHNGGSAGKTSLPTYRYLIPLYLYAPKIIEPKIVHKLASQIDLIPTILSLLGASYESKFYGDDILSEDHKKRAFIGNYQKLGLLRDDILTILSPDKSVKSLKVLKQKLDNVKYKDINTSKEDEEDTITYYQSASYLYKNGLLKK
jgi:phosphoglycerol transferase MdoB-like AlkP superfamily enzyme